MATPEIYPEAAKTPAATRVFVGAKIAPQIARELAHMLRPLEGASGCREVVLHQRELMALDAHNALVQLWSE